jgi:DNA polymerase I
VKKRLVILDGSSLMFRAFYALPLLTAPTGEYTNAIYGFSNMLTKLLADYRPDRLVIAFDKSRHTFRTDLFAAYKGTRDKTPEELSAQIPLLHEFAAAWGITFLELDNFEADDIIGTLATKAAADGGYETMIVTGDRDALQLVRPDVMVLLTKRGITDMAVFDEAAFREEYGFDPIRLIDLKGLMGDTSDNIPGVPGVGQKTAAKLLLAYGSMENVFAHVGEITGKKLKERLLENQAQAELSKQLATIVCAAPIPFEPDAYAITPDRSRFLAFCTRYDLKSVRKAFERLYPEEQAAEPELAADVVPRPSYVMLQTAEEGQAFFARIAAADRLAIAGVYSGRVPHVSLLGMAIAAGAARAYVSSESPAWMSLWPLLQTEIRSCDTYDLKSLYHAGGQPSAKFFDVQLAAYLLDPAAGSYPLERLRLAYAPTAVGVLGGEESAAQAAVWQAVCIAALSQAMRPKLEALDLMKLYQNMELPLVEVLASMEQAGVSVNRGHLREQGLAVGHHIEVLVTEIYALAGSKFNINSPKQLAEVLFERLHLPAGKKTKTGYSTNAEVLEELRLVHPIVDKILAYRLWSKLKSTYLDSIGDLIDPQTQRVHTSFNQMVTATGRLSSSDPNLQNIPVRTDEGKEIRRLFEPGQGYDYLLSADYSQIELRLLAHLSQDKNFVEAFNHGQDIHARTASEVFGVPIADMTPELRRRAKAVNFGIVYGISDYGLSRDLRIPRKEAAGYIESYFAKCSGVKAFIDQVVEKAHANGYVTTMFGRRRELPAIHSKNYNQRTLAERMAMNTPIQGSAADIIKLAMIAAYRKLREQKLRSRMLLQVHDELVLEVPADEVDTVSAILKETMEQTVRLSVPLDIDIHKGKNWAEAK